MPIVAEKLEQAREFIPNLRTVTDYLARGGQPELDGLRLLKAAGVRTIVNLRGTSPGLVGLMRRSPGCSTLDHELEHERHTVIDLGMRFIQIPMDVFGHPAEEQFDQFINLVTDPADDAIFVHCLHGKDRTGVMLGVYRVVAHGWTAEKAYNEMLSCGFDPSRKNLSDALFSYARQSPNDLV